MKSRNTVFPKRLQACEFKNVTSNNIFEFNVGRVSKPIQRETRTG
jgi:hypothetical protein